jgi:hypothetical protein
VRRFFILSNQAGEQHTQPAAVNEAQPAWIFAEPERLLYRLTGSIIYISWRLIMKYLWTLLLAALLLVSCQREAPTSGTSDPGPKDFSKISIVLEKSGGIAGEMERWTINGNGQVVSSKGGQRSLDPAAVGSVVEQLEQMGFFEMEEGGLPTSCRDCFTYTLTVSDGERVKTVTAVEGAVETPQDVLQAVGLVAGLVGAAQ